MHRNHRKMQDVSILNSLEQCYFESLCEKLSLAFSIRIYDARSCYISLGFRVKKEASKQTNKTNLNINCAKNKYFSA